MAKRRTQAEKRLIKNISTLKRNIERRLSNIKKAGLSSPAIETYENRVKKSKKLKYSHLREEDRYYNTSVRGLNYRQLKTLYNRLLYFNTLRTSTVKGAKYFTEEVEPLFDRLKEDNETFSRVMYLYNLFVAERGILDKFKYKIIEVILENFDLNDDEIRERVNELYDNSMEDGEEITYNTKATLKDV